MASKKPPITDEGKLAGYWIDQINLAEREQEPWWRSGDVIVRRYKNEDGSRGNTNAVLDPRRRYAILWSNVQTLRPAIYAKSPVPEVSRRFRDEDPVGKLASEVLERALSFSLDAYDFDGRMSLCVLDNLLPGRGQVWVRYVPHMRTVTAEADDELDEGEEDAEPTEEVEYEEVLCDHVDWKDYLTNPVREWAETKWVCRRVLMDRKQLTKRFGKKGEQVPLDWSPKGYSESTDTAETVKRGQVYEIWDKVSMKAYWVSKSFTTDVLDQRDDPLKLKGFFPCPQPLNATMAPSANLPTADYVLYQDQAEELDELTGRIGKLQDALRMVGFYAGEQKTALQNVFSPGNENKLIPIDTFDLFKDAGGVKGLIEWVPIDMVVQTLSSCYEARAQIINDIYQITGLSDIIRGDSNPNETATAQGIKAQWGSLRVRDRQKDVQRFARDIIRMKAEVIAEHFSVETLRAMTSVKLLTADEKAQLEQTMALVQQAQQAGIPIPPEMMPDPAQVELLEQPTWDDVMGLLKNDALRSFRIDVETDSTIEADETAQKQAYVEFTTSVTGLLKAAAGIVPAAPYTAPLFAEIIKEGSRLFRVSRGMEDVIDKVFSQAEQQPPQVQGPEQPPPPDPNVVKAEEIKGQTAMIQAQSEQERTQMDGQIAQIDAAVKMQELDVKRAALAADPTPQGSA